MPDEEHEGEPRDDEGHDEESEDSDELAEVAATAEREARPLIEGRSFSLLGGELPHRTLLAIAVFIAVFLAVWLALWALLGGWGLGLGWIVALAVGALAVWLLTRSLWADSSRPRTST